MARSLIGVEMWGQPLQTLAPACTRGPGKSQGALSLHPHFPRTVCPVLPAQGQTLGVYLTMASTQRR